VGSYCCGGAAAPPAHVSENGHGWGVEEVCAGRQKSTSTCSVARVAPLPLQVVPVGQGEQRLPFGCARKKWETHWHSRASLKVEQKCCFRNGSSFPKRSGHPVALGGTRSCCSRRAAGCSAPLRTVSQRSRLPSSSDPVGTAPHSRPKLGPFGRRDCPRGTRRGRVRPACRRSICPGDLQRDAKLPIRPGAGSGGCEFESRWLCIEKGSLRRQRRTGCTIACRTSGSDIAARTLRAHRADRHETHSRKQA
jgi:hypothetical protein